MLRVREGEVQNGVVGKVGGERVVCRVRLTSMGYIEAVSHFICRSLNSDIFLAHTYQTCVTMLGLF